MEINTVWHRRDGCREAPPRRRGVGTDDLTDMIKEFVRKNVAVVLSNKFRWVLGVVSGSPKPMQTRRARTVQPRNGREDRICLGVARLRAIGAIWGWYPRRTPRLAFARVPINGFVARRGTAVVPEASGNFRPSRQGVDSVVPREAAFHGAVQDTQVGLYLEKVREQSYRVVDNDFQILRDAGLSEDAIFELTVAAALGAAVRRLNSRLLAVGVTS